MDPDTNIEFRLSANVVGPNQPLDLEMMLPGCCILQELDPAKTRVMINGHPIDQGSKEIRTSPNDLGRLTWAGSAEPGPYAIHVAVADTNGNSAEGEAIAYVLSNLQYHITVTPEQIEEGDSVTVTVVPGPPPGASPRKGAVKAVSAPKESFEDFLNRAGLHFEFDAVGQGTVTERTPASITWQATAVDGGPQRFRAYLADRTGHVWQPGGRQISTEGSAMVATPPMTRNDTFRVALQRSSTSRTVDEPFWPYIRNRTLAIGSDQFADFIERVFVPQTGYGALSPAAMDLSRKARDMRGCNYGAGAYELLKTAAQVFLLLECGGAMRDDPELFDVDDESGRAGRRITVGEVTERLKTYLGGVHLPYIDRVLRNAFRGEPRTNSVLGYGVLHSRIHCPCLIELIWSYWHEEGMLAQTMNAITRRFQNVRAPFDRDPLAHLEIDPLRPLNNLLWGYIQDEWNRLSVKRRAYEYDHHYGLTVYGKAVPGLRPADSRSKFLEAFHTLLHLAYVFYKEDNDTTVIADGFPLLNALKEVHMLLAQGAHNQFGDLPWTARTEMLIQQWILSRPEMRDFLQSRPMVPYKEAWMAPVDTMKTLQGWSDTSVTHFRDLGVYGEQILLSIRWADWIGINNEDSAKNWARSWRPEIQGYIHAYRAVTGADLTNADGVDHTLPAVHMRKRLAMQRSR